jgi:hypothetical protein
MTSLPSEEPTTTTESRYTMDVGKIVRRCFAIWWRNVVSFTALAGVVQIPVFVGMSVLLMRPASRGTRTLEGVVEVLDSVLGLVVSGALTFGVFQDLRARRPRFAETLGVGLRRLFPILVVTLLSSLAIMAGFCALIIPGIIAMVMYSVAIPVTVIEDVGTTAALTRSSNLTSGHRWEILGVLLVTGLVSGGSFFVIRKAVSAFTASMDWGAHAALITRMGTMVAMLPFVALSAVPAVVVYHDLRTGKEGADIEELVKVFD